MLNSALAAKTNGNCSPGNIVAGDGFRISVLTPRLFRVEVSKKNVFEDSPTQSIWFRDTGPVEFEAEQDKKSLIIRTESVSLFFNKSSKKAVGVKFAGSGETVKCANKNNLKGTRRTLDLTFGSAPLGNGLIAKTGVAVYDDSASLLLLENGEIIPRAIKASDCYIFACGKDYRQGIRDFYRIAGPVPLVPRFALGVWWSRYRAYTQREYLELMQRFEDEGIPLTVATVDMDWHWTDLNARFGTQYKRKMMVENTCTGGWTGFSWNTKLFPDYRAFLDALHAKNLAVTLNLHPADGIRFFENMYDEAAAANGVDPATKQPVKFSAGSTAFWNTYFDIVLHPYEDEGVDFWWIDWQQGKKSDVKGLDPLWALNHYHFLDNARGGRLPLILSRYAGIGSHRYPLGFSGDTFINWRVLKFQPYFTATAANTGYTWWSHDIGGHQRGRRDDELYIRWLQFGVFSPVMRLHSTSDDLLGKEPWRYPAEIRNIAKQQLVFRHKLIPYLYTMDYATHREGRALCEPVYYSYPDIEDAYQIKNEYMFGSRLLVIPVTGKADKKIKMAAVRAWIPPGRWTDIFTGDVYEGERFATLYRDLASIPVLAKQGSIIPLSGDAGNSAENPDNLELWVFRGDGKFDLYEDCGTGDYGTRQAVTTFEISQTHVLTFTVHPAAGDLSVLPAKRNFRVVFKDIVRVGSLSVFIDEKRVDEFFSDGENLSEKPLEIELKNVAADAGIRIEITEFRPRKNPPVHERIAELFSRWQAGNARKSRLYKKARSQKDLIKCERRIRRTVLPRGVKKALLACFDDTVLPATKAGGKQKGEAE